MKKWMFKHDEVIVLFLHKLNSISNDFILKGGTALKQCYALDRFSEYIDLDVKKNKDIIPFIDKFSKDFDYSYRIAKNTDTVKRCFINYGTNEHPLKIEVSYRYNIIKDKDINNFNGITVYNIDRIAQMKANAYSNRDKIRDLYDLTFICNNYFDKLSDSTINNISDAIICKGLEQFDYLTETQKDPLINEDKLATDFLKMYDKLGLLYDKKEIEKSKLNNFKKNNLKPKLPNNPNDGNSGTSDGR